MSTIEDEKKLPAEEEKLIEGSLPLTQENLEKFNACDENANKYDFEGDNVSDVDIRQKKAYYGHLPLLQQVSRIGLSAFKIYKPPNGPNLLTLMANLEKYCIAIRAETIKDHLKNEEDDHFLSRRQKAQILEEFTVDEVLGFIQE